MATENNQWIDALFSDPYEDQYDAQGNPYPYMKGQEEIQQQPQSFMTKSGYHWMYSEEGGAINTAIQKYLTHHMPGLEHQFGSWLGTIGFEKWDKEKLKWMTVGDLLDQFMMEHSVIPDGSYFKDETYKSLILSGEGVNTGHRNSYWNIFGEEIEALPEAQYVQNTLESMDKTDLAHFNQFVSSYNDPQFKEFYTSSHKRSEIARKYGASPIFDNIAKNQELIGQGETLEGQVLSWQSGKAYEGFMPARFMGYLEDSPELYQDVLNASRETGADPRFIYLVSMQEGLLHGNTRNMFTEYYSDVKTPYVGDYPIDLFSQVGLEAVGIEEGNMLSKGYLKSPLDSNLQKDASRVNEDHMYYRGGNISMSSALRGTGGLIRLNQDYMNTSTWYDHDNDKRTPSIKPKGFKDLGIDFNSLSETSQMFWTYASINAGHNDAKMVLEAYGPEPWTQQGFLNKLDVRHEDYSANFANWMVSTIRVTGAFEVMQNLNPFENTDVDVDKEVFNLLK